MAYVLSDKARSILSTLQKEWEEEVDFIGAETHELADKVGLEIRSFTGTVNSMFKKGLIDRKTDEETGNKYVTLTEKGKMFDPDTEKTEEQ